MTQQIEQRIAGGVAYTLTRRRVKNLNMRILSDGRVAVSAAPRIPSHEVDGFVAARADWVARAQRRVQARAQAEQAEVLPDKEEALSILEELCLKYYPEFAATCPGGRMPRVRVRDMHTRWGSCSLRTGTLTFSLRLAAKPLAVQEYVVVHEFSHFSVPNHSPAYWAVVAAHMPDWKARRRLLTALPR